jgi:hypothetical protein
MGHNDNSLLTGPTQGHTKDKAEEISRKLNESVPLIDFEETVSPDTSQNVRDNIVPEDTDLAGILGRSAGNVLFPAGGGTIGETIAENTERVTGGAVTEPIDDTADDISSGIDNTVDNVSSGVNNAVDEAVSTPGNVAEDVADAVAEATENATPDLSGLGGFADKFLIGLALTLVAAAAASSVFS